MHESPLQPLHACKNTCFLKRVLQVLNLDGNLLVSPPREVLQQGTAVTLEYIKRLKLAREVRVLDLCNFGMRAIPLEVIKNNTKVCCSRYGWCLFT